MLRTYLAGQIEMDKTRLFEYLPKREFSEVMELLQSVYDAMDTKQRRAVLGEVFDLFQNI